MTEYTKEQYRKDDLPLDAIDYAYIDGLNTFMQTAHNCRNNGAVNLLCCLKNFILYAIRNEWLEKEPFRYYGAGLHGCGSPESRTYPYR